MYVFTVLLFLLLLPMIEFKHLLPLGGHSASEYGRSVLYCTLMPFSELVVLLFLVPDFKEAREQKNLWKMCIRDSHIRRAVRSAAQRTGKRRHCH